MVIFSPEKCPIGNQTAFWITLWVCLMFTWKWLMMTEVQEQHHETTMFEILEKNCTWSCFFCETAIGAGVLHSLTAFLLLPYPPPFMWNNGFYHGWFYPPVKVCSYHSKTGLWVTLSQPNWLDSNGIELMNLTKSTKISVKNSPELLYLMLFEVTWAWGTLGWICVCF